MNHTDAAVAAVRFGLGARPGEIAEIARAGAPAWLAAQLGREAPPPAPLLGLAPAAENMAALMTARRRGDGEIERLIRNRYREIYIDEATRRTQAQIASDAPFRERLVAFWSNHFTVSVQRPPVLGLAGAFEREAIRPHVAGRFRDMLGAVARHPAMLVYLDNAVSIGPASRAGRRRERGLNENFARELLELHTLGVDGGYTQDDVRALARILTGWSLERGDRPGGGAPGGFAFHAVLHEPGDKVLLGRRFAEDGMAEGESALDLLARHSATARHVATRFARHFVADAPAESVVARLARTFADTDGDLAALARAAIALPEAWTPLTKLKTGAEFVVSALRAAGAVGDRVQVLGALRLLSQAPFAAPSPQGWADDADAWIGPEAVVRRGEWALAAGDRAAAGAVTGEGLLDAALGPLAGAQTRAAVARAGSQRESIALALMAPEFQRR